MADSKYHILEFRVIDHDPCSDGGQVDVFVKISDANDFMPIAGWYGARVPSGRGSFEFLGECMARQSHLMGEAGWTKRAPPGEEDPRPVAYPAVMNKAMKFALGLPNFRCGPEAERLRIAGADIPRKVEAEQAAVIHWLLPFAITGGDDWLERAKASLVEP